MAASLWVSEALIALRGAFFKWRAKRFERCVCIKTAEENGWCARHYDDEFFRDDAACYFGGPYYMDLLVGEIETVKVAPKF